MRSEEEIRNALQARIKQLDQGLKILNTSNGPFLSRAIYEAVREELDTFHKWVLNDKGEK
jgi:hypothetical protein